MSEDNADQQEDCVECPKCGRQKMCMTTFHYNQPVQRRDGSVYHDVVDIPEFTTLVCSVCRHVEFTPESHDVITAAICKCRGVLTPDELHQGLKKLPDWRSLDGLLGITSTRMAEWEKGRFIMPLSISQYLRILFEVPEALQYVQEHPTVRHASFQHDESYGKDMERIGDIPNPAGRPPETTG